MAEIAIGYAVKDRGDIAVATVSPTVLGAQVNGFSVCGGLIVAGSAPAAMIAEAWEDFARQSGLQIVMVEIREKAHADG
jgi:hypothetical protein